MRAAKERSGWRVLATLVLLWTVPAQAILAYAPPIGAPPPATSAVDELLAELGARPAAEPASEPLLLVVLAVCRVLEVSSEPPSASARRTSATPDPSPQKWVCSLKTASRRFFQAPPSGATHPAENRRFGAETAVGGKVIGNFSLAFVDVAVPVSGLDLEVVRTYDTRQAAVQGDFGQGWTLDIRQGSYRNNRPPGDGWQIAGGFLPCDSVQESKSHLTVIRLSEREVYRFALRIVDGVPSTGGGCYGRAEFEYVDGPIPGATLQILGNDQVFQDTQSSDRVLSLDTLDTYVPENVRLTTRDLRVFDLNLAQGVTRVEDPNGNELRITEAGVFHSNGKAIALERDAEGRITRVEDPMGFDVGYTYDAAGDLVGVTDQEDNVTSFRYDADHYLVSIVDPLGREVSAQDFDEGGRLIAVCHGEECQRLEHHLDDNVEVAIDPTGRRTTFEYDSRGNVIAAEDLSGGRRSFEYDARDHLLVERDALGREVRFTRDEAGNMLTRTLPHPSGADPADYTTSFTYDARGYLTSIITPSGVRSLDRDAQGNLLALRDGADVLATWAFNSSGVVTSQADLHGAFEYQDLDPFGEPRHVIEPFGREVDITYDAAGRLVTMSDGSSTSSYTYDALGRELRSESEDGSWFEQSFDHLDDWVEQRSSTGATVGRALDARGRLQRWDLANGAQTSYSYDAAGRLLEERDTMGRSTTYEHDAAGRVSAIVAPDGGRTQLEYNVAGEVIAQTDAEGGRTAIAYGPDGHTRIITDSRGELWTTESAPLRSSVTDPLDRTTVTELSGRGIPVRTTYPDGKTFEVETLATAPLGEEAEYPVRIVDEGGRERTYAYDEQGRLVQATDLGGAAYSFGHDSEDLDRILAPSGETIVSYTYDSRDWTTSLTYGDGGTFQLAYDGINEPAVVTKPSGAQVTRSYDVSGQLTSVSTTDGVMASYTWHDDGTPGSLTDGTGTTTFGYDAAGRLATWTRSDGGAVVYEHDLVGRVTVVRARADTESEELVTRYGYDPAGLLVQMTDPAGGVTLFERDAVGRVTTRTLPNGVVTEYAYDLRDRVIGVVHRSAGGQVVASYTYDRAPGGEPTRVTREDGSVRELAYDTAGRLERETWRDPGGVLLEEITYAYDVDGNRTSRTTSAGAETYAYDPGFQLSSITGPTEAAGFEHDADGRVSSLGGEWSLGWDGLDRVTSASSTATGETVTYAHDGDGRRTSVSSAGETHRWVTAPRAADDLEAPHLLVDGQGAVTRAYAYAGAFPLFRLDGSSPSYLLEDGLGSVVGRTDASGALVEELSYDGFGNERSGSVPALPGEHRFRGEWQDGLTGLYHLRARQYDPQTGLFLSRDPASPAFEIPETAHPYLFAFSNPMVYEDPTGTIGIVSVGVTMSVGNIVKSVRIGALNLARAKIRAKINDVIADLLVEAIQRALSPTIGWVNPLTKLAGKGSEWKDFERAILQNTLCKLLPPASQAWLWFEPTINESGRPLADGYGCQRARDPAQSHHRFKPGHREPDFVISEAPPSQKKRGVLIGELKIGMSTLYSMMHSSRRKGQWQAIHMYARNHEYFPHPLVLLTFRKDREYHRRGVIRKLRADHVAKGRVGFLIWLQ